MGEYVLDVLTALKNGTSEYCIEIAAHYPLFTAATMEDIVQAALRLVKIEEVETSLATTLPSPPHGSEEVVAAYLSSDEIKQATTLLLPKKKRLKTQPVIVLDTGKIIRAQGRPPKDIKPLYAKSEEEAQLLILQQRLAAEE